MIQIMIKYLHFELRTQLIRIVSMETTLDVTSQGERVPQSMEIQHSQANIKGDTSNFMKNIENYISN